jgi:hypothetical protein
MKPVTTARATSSRPPSASSSAGSRRWALFRLSSIMYHRDCQTKSDKKHNRFGRAISNIRHLVIIEPRSCAARLKGYDSLASGTGVGAGRLAPASPALTVTRERRLANTSSARRPAPTPAMGGEHQPLLTSLLTLTTGDYHSIVEVLAGPMAPECRILDIAANMDEGWRNEA